jgi:hypothetical protein
MREPNVFFVFNRGRYLICTQNIFNMSNKFKDTTKHQNFKWDLSPHLANFCCVGHRTLVIMFCSSNLWVEWSYPNWVETLRADISCTTCIAWGDCYLVFRNIGISSIHSSSSGISQPWITNWTFTASHEVPETLLHWTRCPNRDKWPIIFSFIV